MRRPASSNGISQKKYSSRGNSGKSKLVQVKTTHPINRVLTKRTTTANLQENVLNRYNLYCLNVQYKIEESSIRAPQRYLIVERATKPCILSRNL